MADITKKSTHTLAEIDEAVDIALSGGGSGSGLTFINETAVEALVSPVPSELKIIEHAESEEI